MNLVQSQRLAIRIQFLESVLERSAGLLASLKYQRGITLVKDLTEGREYRSMIDFLTGLMVPSIIPHMQAFYDGTGPNLAEGFSTGYINRLDLTLAVVIQHLARTWVVLKEQGIKTPEQRAALAIVEVIELRLLFPEADPYILDNRRLNML